jgi:predicted nucleic acid-binding protein
MKPLDPCLIDSSIWIEAQRNPKWFASLIVDLPDIATGFTAAGEYAVGCYAAEQKKTRDEARRFFDNSVQAVACHPHLPDDFLTASRLVGEAILAKAARPNYADGLIAACARRLDRVVWTKDEIHFSAMGCRIFNPLKDSSVQAAP